VATDLDGDPREARILVRPRAVRQRSARYVPRPDWHAIRSRLVQRRRRAVFGGGQHRNALVRWWRDDDRALGPDAPAEDIADAIPLRPRRAAGAYAGNGLRHCIFGAGAADGRRFSPIYSEDHLLRHWMNWLAGASDRRAAAPRLEGVRPAAPLTARLSGTTSRRSDRAAPAHFTTPLGRKIAIAFTVPRTPDPPCGLQRSFGTRAPADDRRPSPYRSHFVARSRAFPGRSRPICRCSGGGPYADVRKDMRRPLFRRHPGPEDPTQAETRTLRVKPAAPKLQVFAARWPAKVSSQDRPAITVPSSDNHSSARSSGIKFETRSSHRITAASAKLIAGKPF